VASGFQAENLERSQIGSKLKGSVANFSLWFSRYGIISAYKTNLATERQPATTSKNIIVLETSDGTQGKGGGEEGIQYGTSMVMDWPRHERFK
jgi:hypothetical protein